MRFVLCKFNADVTAITVLKRRVVPTLFIARQTWNVRSRLSRETNVTEMSKYLSWNTMNTTECLLACFLLINCNDTELSWETLYGNIPWDVPWPGHESAEQPGRPMHPDRYFISFAKISFVNHSLDNAIYISLFSYIINEPRQNVSSRAFIYN